jgi:hypothetical protein
MEEEYRMQKAKEEERKTSFSYAAPKTSTTEHADNEEGDHDPTESSTTDQPKEQIGGDDNDDDAKDELAEKLDEVNLDEDNQPLQTDDAESTTTTLADLPKMENTSLERPRQAAEDPKVKVIWWIITDHY